MNRKMWIVALSAAITVGGLAGTGAALAKYNDGISKTSIVATDYKQKLTVKRAKELALAAVAGSVQSVEVQTEQGVTYYKFIITVKVSWSYEVLIDAYSGKRLFVTTDSNGYRYFYQISAGKWIMVGNKTLVTVKVSAKQAAAIAAAHIGGKVVSIKRDDDHDKLTYEIKLSTKKGEVTVYVLAANGKILSVVRDSDYDDDRYRYDDDDDYDYDDHYKHNGRYDDDDDHHKHHGRGGDDDHGDDDHHGRH